MKKYIILLFLFAFVDISAQDIEADKWDVMNEYVEYPKSGFKSGSSAQFYFDLNSYISYCDQNPLRNPPITFIKVAFHVMLDDSGGNNVFTNTQEGRDHLLQILERVNEIYSGEASSDVGGCSNPVEGTVELPNYDTRIRFTLGSENERIYFYEDTELNHEPYFTKLNDTIRRRYPDRMSTINVFFPAAYAMGRIIKENVEITNGGSGYTSPPSVSFSSGSANATALIENGEVVGIDTIINSGSYYGFIPPAIQLLGGGGEGAEAIVTQLAGGASGIAMFPYPADHISFYDDLATTMLKSHEPRHWLERASTLAHELAHLLDLRHTYCGGGALAVCQGCYKNCDHTDYLSDIFGGECPGTCPHLQRWADPYCDTISSPEKTTNHIMGAAHSASRTYFSPMEAGIMHRTLALKSTRKYVKEGTYSAIPLVIEENEIWDFNIKLYRDIHVTSGAILEISDTFKLPDNAAIIINNGSALVITGSLELANLNKIVVNSGGTLKFAGTSDILISGSGKVEVQPSAYFCLEDGASVSLSDYNSVINLRDGFINGVNTAVLSPSTCLADPTTYAVAGEGKISKFNQDLYIQNESIISDSYFAGKNIYVGRSVTTSKPIGDVLINEGVNVIFDAEQNVIFESGFELELGGSFEVK